MRFCVYKIGIRSTTTIIIIMKKKSNNSKYTAAAYLACNYVTHLFVTLEKTKGFKQTEMSKEKAKKKSKNEWDGKKSKRKTNSNGIK